MPPLAELWPEIKRPIETQMDRALIKYKASPEMSKMAHLLLDNTINYIDFCIKYKKNPEDKNSLKDFLLSKSISIAKMTDYECAVSMFDAANNVRMYLPYAKGPAAFIIIALVGLDVLAVANSCEFIHEGAYNMLWKTSEPRIISTIRSSNRFSSADFASSYLDNAKPRVLQCNMDLKKQMMHQATVELRRP